MNRLTYTMENYLEAIYEISKQTNFARVSDIATYLNVTKASASSAVQTLLSKGLVATEKYKEVYLTQEGLEIAKITQRKHIIIKKFLLKALNVEEEIADIDACAIEHVISNITVNAMEKYIHK